MRLLVFFFAGLECLVFAGQPALAQGDPQPGDIRTSKRKLAKFEPPDQCLVFVGQSLSAIGGLEEFSDGYLDHFPKPAGFTMYTNLRPGDKSFGHTYDGNDGLTETDDWGDGPSNMSLQIGDSDFDGMALAIGLELVNHEVACAKGDRDDQIRFLGQWIKSLGKRPVYLRIGYEFDGHPWNHYDREGYLASFKRIRALFKSMDVQNVAFVWQSCGFMSSVEQLEQWYPGDDQVDWCGYSFFGSWRQAKMIEFARKKGKPVFIAEAAPVVNIPGKTDGSTFQMSLGDPKQAERAWQEWFVPFFKTIDDHSDVVKAVSYINHDWHRYPMWKENPTFRGIDSRLQLSPQVSGHWKRRLATDRFLNYSSQNYQTLWQSR